MRVQAWQSLELKEAGEVGSVEARDKTGSCGMCQREGLKKVSSGRGMWPGLYFQLLALWD